MKLFIQKNFTKTEMLLIFSGVLFFASTIFIALGGDLTVNFIAKAFYFVGIAILIFTT